MGKLGRYWDAAIQRKVWALAAPMVLCNLSVPLVALVDTAVVGHLPHASQLGAVAVGSSWYVLLVGIMSFLRMGTTGFSAQAQGRQDPQALRLIWLQGLLLALALACVLALSAWPLAGVFMHLINPSQALSQATETFFGIRLLGLPAALANYALIGWFLGTQNARVPLLMMLLTNLCNMVLSVVLVWHFDFGVAGAATAAVCGEWLGALLGLYLSAQKLKHLKSTWQWQRLKRWLNWRPLLSVNRDIFVRSLALQGVFLLIALQGARLGESTVAANLLLLNGLVITAYALDGLAHAIEALAGQAIGARQREALKQVLWVAGSWSLLISALFSAAFFGFGEAFINMQTSLSEVRSLAYEYLIYLAVLPLIAVGSYVLDGLFIGATQARPMRNAMLLALAVSVPVALGLQRFGNHGLWLSFVFFMSARTLLMAVYAWRLTRRLAF